MNQHIQAVSRMLYQFGDPNSDAQKALFKFNFFQLGFNKKYVKEALNDFKMHLFRNCLEYKNVDRRENNETKRSKRKKKLSTKVFSLI